MSDDDGRALAEQLGECLVDLRLVRHVDGARGVVENQHGGIREDRPRDGDALTLAAREVVPALANHGVVTLIELADEVVGLCRGGCGDHLGPGGVGTCIGDVVVNAGREQEWLVGHEADGPAQAVAGEGVHVVTGDGDCAVAEAVEAHEQPRERRFAAAGTPDDCDPLAGADVQIEPVEDQRRIAIGARSTRDAPDRLGAIGESHVVESHFHARRPAVRLSLWALRQIDGAGTVCHEHRLVEHLEDALRGRLGPLAEDEQHPDEPERRLQQQDVQVEGGQIAHGERVADDQVTAHQQHHRHCQVRQVLDDRRVVRPGVVLQHVGPAQPLGRPSHLLHLTALGSKGLHDTHAVHALVGDGGDLSVA